MDDSGESPLPDSVPLESSCPKCGQPMEAGFVYYNRQLFSWMATRPEHWWKVDVSDHLAPRSVHVMLYAAAARCRACRIVTFEYSPE
jgi:hypothetical protein